MDAQRKDPESKAISRVLKFIANVSSNSSYDQSVHSSVTALDENPHPGKNETIKMSSKWGQWESPDLLMFISQKGSDSNEKISLTCEEFCQIDNPKVIKDIIGFSCPSWDEALVRVFPDKKYFRKFGTVVETLKILEQEKSKALQEKLDENQIKVFKSILKIAQSEEYHLVKGELDRSADFEEIFFCSLSPKNIYGALLSQEKARQKDETIQPKLMNFAQNCGTSLLSQDDRCEVFNILKDLNNAKEDIKRAKDKMVFHLYQWQIAKHKENGAIDQCFNKEMKIADDHYSGPAYQWPPLGAARSPMPLTEGNFEKRLIWINKTIINNFGKYRDNPDQQDKRQEYLADLKKNVLSVRNDYNRFYSLMKNMEQKIGKTVEYGIYDIEKFFTSFYSKGKNLAEIVEQDKCQLISEIRKPFRDVRGELEEWCELNEPYANKDEKEVLEFYILRSSFVDAEQKAFEAFGGEPECREYLIRVLELCPFLLQVRTIRLEDPPFLGRNPFQEIQTLIGGYLGNTTAESSLLQSSADENSQPFKTWNEKTLEMIYNLLGQLKAKE